jgi:hypothetical protein
LKAKGREGWDTGTGGDRRRKAIDGSERKEEGKEEREEKERFWPLIDLRLDTPVLKYYNYLFYVVDFMQHTISFIYSYVHKPTPRCRSIHAGSVHINFA